MRKGNLAAQLWVSGELSAAVGRWEESLADAISYGQRSFERWVPGALLVPFYILGRWDELTEGAEAFLADVEAGRPHYLASQAYSSRALIRFARGDDDGALADGRLGIAAGERAADNQALLPTLARVAHIQLGLGNTEGARKSAEMFLEAVEQGRLGFEASSLHELSWTLSALGYGHELADALSDRHDPWSRAASAYALGDPLSAAEIMGEIGALAEEAYARLAAGRRLIEKNRDSEADEQLRRALGFYRGVEATRYIRDIHTLRPELA